MENGLHVGAQVCVRLRGETVADYAIGNARAGKPLRPDHRILWLSAGKPLTAVAILKLWEQGLLDLQDPISRHLPEFGTNGKGEVLLWHLLTHTAAYQPPPVDWARTAWNNVIEQISAAEIPAGRLPGEYAAYDPQTGWLLLAEIVWRLTALPFYDFIETEILHPIGCRHTCIGMPGEDWSRGVEADTVALLHDTTGPSREGALTDGDAPRWPGETPQRAAAHNPGGGALGPVRELCRFYEALASGELLQPQTLQEATRRWRTDTYDETFRHKVDWGLGFILNSNRYGWENLPYGYGRHAGESTFGHGGMQSTTGFADPENGLCVAATFNGLPGEPKHQRRSRDFTTLLYEDLGLDK